jgi:hypothetical protein
LCVKGCVLTSARGWVTENKSICDPAFGLALPWCLLGARQLNK